MKPVKSVPAAKPEVATVVAAPAPEAKPAKTKIIKVLKADAKFRGAREAWYVELKKHDGKPLAEFEKATDDKPPSLPKSGRKEAPSGWTSYFTRTGIMQVEEVEAKA